MSENRFRVLKSKARPGEWIITGPPHDDGIRVILCWRETRREALMWARHFRRQWAAEHKGEKG